MEQLVERLGNDPQFLAMDVNAKSVALMKALQPHILRRTDEAIKEVAMHLGSGMRSTELSMTFTHWNSLEHCLFIHA